MILWVDGRGVHFIRWDPDIPEVTDDLEDFESIDKQTEANLLNGTIIENLADFVRFDRNPGDSTMSRTRAIGKKLNNRLRTIGGSLLGRPQEDLSFTDEERKAIQSSSDISEYEGRQLMSFLNGNDKMSNQNPATTRANVDTDIKGLDVTKELQNLPALAPSLGLNIPLLDGLGKKFSQSVKPQSFAIADTSILRELETRAVILYKRFQCTRYIPIDFAENEATGYVNECKLRYNITTDPTDTLGKNDDS